MADTLETHVEALRDAKTRVETVERELGAARVQRDDAMLAALEAGMGPKAIAEAAGVTRVRVYQVKAKTEERP